MRPRRWGWRAAIVYWFMLPAFISIASVGLHSVGGRVGGRRGYWSLGPYAAHCRRMISRIEVPLGTPYTVPGKSSGS